MSVFQRGGNYLHRRLTKLYSDTKQSYETATVASKITADEDPTLKALHREFRIQKDRLLAWGLQWSDTNATPSPDVEIDQKLDQAGLGHVVALVMSDIQKLLIESENLQNPQESFQEKISACPLDSKVSPGRSELPSDNIVKSRSLLSQLITCIDSLYKLSESRRTMSTSSRMEKASKESLLKENPLSASSPDSQTQTIRSSPRPAGDGNQLEEFVRQDTLFIDSSCIALTLDSSSESETPPPYEEVMPLEKTRLSGMLDITRLADKQLSALGIKGESPKPVVVEYIPTIPDRDNSLQDLHCAAVRYAKRIFDNQSSSEASRTGSLPLLGYTIDSTNSRHGFVYELPSSRHHLDVQNSTPIVSNLRAMIPSKRDESDQPSPTLEDRFRLGFNILLSVLHWSMMGIRHESLNSSNIVILSNQGVKPAKNAKFELTAFDLRKPYLLHSPPITDIIHRAKGQLANMYRHANDTTVRESSRGLVFDIYSFGLILLEIGLWTPVSRLWKPKYTNSTFTLRVKSIYVPKLASRCGTAYMKVVQTCVHAPEVSGPDWSIMSVADTKHFWCSYMVRIGRELSRCCAIDVEGPSCELYLSHFEQLNDSQSLLKSHSTSNKDDTTQSKLEIVKTTSSPPSRPERSAPQGIAMSPAAATPASETTSPVQPTTLKKWNDIDVPQECLDQWNHHLMPRISKLLQKALDSSMESCSASLMMVGKTPETARTTICIQCTSVEKVRDCLKRNFRCKKGWGLVVLRGDIRRSGKARRKGRAQNKASSQSRPYRPEEYAYQQRPHFGASIGAFRDNQHLPPVSFGGAILVDGKPYGMTVHHMLDTPSDDEDEAPELEASDVQRSAANDSDTWLSGLQREGSSQQSETDLLATPDVLEISDDESEGSTIRPDYIDFETGNGAFWFAGDGDSIPDLEDDLEDDSDDDGDDLDEDEDDDDRVSVGDITGIDPSDEEEVYVTQPAIDDIDDDFFPCIEDRDDDHLASHSLGYIHASSGIRRVVTGAHKHEVDWALIKIRDERLAICNTIHQQLARSKRCRKAKATLPPSSSSAQSQEAVTHLTTIAPSSTLSRLPVHCHGRTSGLQSGRISPALALVKLHGRTSFSSSWVVEGGGFGIPGDSGAWIYDPQTGRLCGHVLAWGRQSHTAYMAPMEILFEDIRRRLGADRVELPGVDMGERLLPRPEVDVWPDELQKDLRCLPAPGRSEDEDGKAKMKMKLEGDMARRDTKKMELAFGNLQIGDQMHAQAEQRSTSISISTKSPTKDIPHSLTYQLQGSQHGLQTVLTERVLGSRVA